MKPHPCLNGPQMWYTVLTTEYSVHSILLDKLPFTVVLAIAKLSLWSSRRSGTESMAGRICIRTVICSAWQSADGYSRPVARRTGMQFADFKVF